MPGVNDDFFKKITSFVPAMIAVYNIRTGQYLYVNDGIKTLLGFDPEAFLDGGVQYATSLVHPEDLKAITAKNIEVLKRVNATGLDEKADFEYRMRHADGSWRWLHTDGGVFSRDAAGSVEYVINISIDITDRKHTEEALRQRIENDPSMLEAIVQSSDDAIVGKTLDGIIRSWNQGAEKIFGYAAHEAIGQHITLIIPPDRWSEEDVIISRIRAGESISHFETQRLRKDGKLIDISITVSPIRNARGEIFGASKIARDISDRKRHEEALRDEERRKDEFLAVLAHELRNPLAPISSAMQILQMTDSSTDEGKWAVNVVNRQLHHMTRLIDDLLDISRISSNKLQLHKENVAVADFLQSAIETSEPIIEEARHTFNTSVPSKPLYVYGDAIRLSQIVSNLLTNAAKYTPPEGTINVDVREGIDEVIIQVRDSGVGIPEEMQPRIFDMFVQGDRAPHASRGLGIGLTLVKRLLTMHDGTIEVYSEGVNKGSVFTVRLPLVRVAAETTDFEIDRMSERSPLRILVVDDNKDALVTLEMALRLQGNATETANDGLEAIKTAQEFKPDVILLDIGMPNMNGYEAARMIRSQTWGQPIKLVAVTGWGQVADKNRAYDAGFDHHMTKPVDPKELTQLLSSFQATETHIAA